MEMSSAAVLFVVFHSDSTWHKCSLSYVAQVAREICNFYIIPTGLFSLMIMRMIMMMMMKKEVISGNKPSRSLWPGYAYVQMGDSPHQLIIGAVSLSYHISFRSMLLLVVISPTHQVPHEVCLCHGPAPSAFLMRPNSYKLRNDVVTSSECIILQIYAFLKALLCLARNLIWIKWKYKSCLQTRVTDLLVRCLQFQTCIPALWISWVTAAVVVKTIKIQLFTIPIITAICHTLSLL